MVRLLRQTEPTTTEEGSGFNPTMVRLLHRILARHYEMPEQFQSHNGAIAARNQIVELIKRALFQSHNGAIAARMREAIRQHLELRFNPTMVRLLPPVPKQPNAMLLWFQSHNGAIAAYPAIGENLNFPCVSIPQWCDCCKSLTPSIPDRSYSFNPTMVRLLHLESAGRLLSRSLFQSHNGAIAAICG